MRKLFAKILDFSFYYSHLFLFISLIIGCSNGNGNITNEPCYMELSLNENPSAPLTGIARFSTPEESRIRIKVLGDQEVAGEFNEFKTEHEIPVLGLYPDRNNLVEITTINLQGKESRHICELSTEPIPEFLRIPERLEVIIDELPETEERLLFYLFFI